MRTKTTMGRLWLAGALCVAAAGCGTLTSSNQQVLMVRTILDNREIGGVGCVLTNDAGRWFVTAPGRVTVQRSAGNLWIDCRRPGSIAGSSAGQSVGQDMVASKASTGTTVGNAVFTAGLGYLLDKRTGAGFDYPDTLTVLMRGSGRQAEGDEPVVDPGAVVY